jgi:hypothetical protein
MTTDDASDGTDRAYYIDWLVYWLAQTDTDPTAFHATLESQSTPELAKTFFAARQNVAALNIRCGIEHSAPLSPEQKGMLLDAIVALDTGFLALGSEPPVAPSAGGLIDEAFRLWARVRRRRLARLWPDALAAECLKMLETHSAQDARRDPRTSQIVHQTRHAKPGNGALLFCRISASGRPALPRAGSYRQGGGPILGGITLSTR